MRLPPGPRLLLGLASQCVVPSILSYLVLYLGFQKLGIFLSSPILVLLSLLAKPFTFFCQVQLRPLIYRYNAKRNRASGAPLVPGTAAELGRKAVASLTSGYPADIFQVWMLKHGWIYQLPDPTKMQVRLYICVNFSLRDAFSQFFTFEPDHVKVRLSGHSMRRRPDSNIRR